MTIYIQGLFLFLCIWLSQAAQAQTSEASLIDSLRHAYQQLDYENSERFAQLIFSSYSQFTNTELAEAHVTLAQVYFARSNQAEARRQFESALSIQPDLALDPLLVSPKVLALFDELRGEMQQASTDEDPLVMVRYVRQPDLRAAAAWRSMLVPGLGQMYKKEQKKGQIFVVAWTGLVLSTGVAHIQRQRAQSSYRAARDPVSIASRYDTYNRRHKMRNGLALATAGVWLYSYLDALIRPADLPQAASSRAKLTASATSIGFTYSF